MLSVQSLAQPPAMLFCLERHGGGGPSAWAFATGLGGLDRVPASWLCSNLPLAEITLERIS